MEADRVSAKSRCVEIPVPPVPQSHSPRGRSLLLLACIACAPTLGVAQSPDMDAFRKQIEGELAAMKASYEGRIKELESRIGTLESGKTRLERQVKTPPE